MSALSAARKHAATAKSALKTSMFKWSPDYVSAAHAYEKAAISFKAAGEPAESAEAYEKAAEAHAKAENEAGAAKCWESAADIRLGFFRDQSKGIEGGLAEAKAAAALFGQAAMVYREEGMAAQASSALTKKGQALADGAASLPEAHKERDPLLTEALQNMLAACEVLELHNKLVFSKDTYRNALNLVVKMRRWGDAIQVLSKMIPVYKDLNQTSGSHKLRLSAVIIHLQRNDLTAARAAFREGFDDADYLRSEECAAAEDLLRAWEALDVDEVRAVIARPVFTFLERQVALVARDLSPYNASAQGRDEPLMASPLAALDAKTEPVSSSETLQAAAPTAEAQAVSEEDPNRAGLFARKPAPAPAPAPAPTEPPAAVPVAAPAPAPALAPSSVPEASPAASVPTAELADATQAVSDEEPRQSTAGPKSHVQAEVAADDADEDEDDLAFLR
ncbi:Gamma-soluble NSF attachment protein [Hondaea fermentalgiana]|uniref:Gamma-soluble NSF attachment protein n=1 Tax=Hondaea fermentalgiana TaxID=2315210 RepID=A0A2R5G9L3_9STRA|nr:Gamma-soluble NSF attachment protein [Hondaea fermentalgiana]|eukprot:GBG27727.1 Gamma-soluble NSF attachment protein [Hondaea fermentalgiana]